MIAYMKAPPTKYVLHYRQGKIRREGAGLSFFYYVAASTIVTVPFASADAPFVFQEVTGDFQPVTIQGQILYEMQKLTRETGAAVIWITHDLSVVAGLADQVSVMYAGRIVEQGTAEQVLGRPRHPYTRGLLDSVPANNARGARLKQIPGMTPSLLDLPPGCPFRERCSYAQSDCARTPLMRPLTAGQSVRCHHPLA